MGMFDYVSYQADCLKCGFRLKGFQSKDGHRQLQDLTLEELVAQADPGDDIRIYDYCPCKAWNEYRVIPGEPVKVVAVKE